MLFIFEQLISTANTEFTRSISHSAINLLSFHSE